MIPAFSSKNVSLVILAIAVPQLVQDGVFGPLVATVASQGDETPFNISLILAVPWVAAGLLSYLVVSVLKRYSNRFLMSVSAAFCAATFPIMALGYSFPLWLAISAAIGFAMAIRWIAGEVWLLSIVPENQRPTVIGFQETIIGMTGIFGPLILIVTGVSGWLPFLACAIILAIAALIPLLVQKNNVFTEDNLDPPTPPLSGSLFPAAVASALGGATETAAHGFLPISMMSGTGLFSDPLFAATVLGIGGTLVQVPFGMFFRADLRLICSIVALTTIVPILFIPFSEQILTMYVAVLVIGALCACYYTFAVLYAGSVAPQSLGPALALIAIANTMGSIAGPPIMGMTLEIFPKMAGILTGISVMSIAAIGALMIALISMRERRSRN